MLPVPLLLLALLPSSDLDDTVLAARIRDGDAAAFKTFFDRHHGLLYRYLRRRGVSDAVAEDLMQNAFLTIWEHRERIDTNQSLRAYLFRMCHTRTLNHFRDTARLQDDTVLAAVPVFNTPDHHAEVALMQRTFAQVLAALPERRRAVFELCFLEKLSYREAAEALGISLKTVEHQMGHALKALRAAFEAFR
jgi:RNA polymerase sigma-70 factor (ECF subfamily)